MDLSVFGPAIFFGLTFLTFVFWLFLFMSNGTKKALAGVILKIVEKNVLATPTPNSKQCKKPQVHKDSPSTLFRVLTTLKREKTGF